MATHLHSPQPPLSDYIQLLWLSEEYTQPHPQERLLPTGTMTLVIFLFCRIRRFQQVLETVDDVSEVDWTRVALRCGYFDQAHFVHDFRAFSGVNPTTYLRHRTHRNHVAVHD